MWDFPNYLLPQIIRPYKTIETLQNIVRPQADEYDLKHEKPREIKRQINS